MSIVVVFNNVDSSNLTPCYMQFHLVGRVGKYEVKYNATDANGLSSSAILSVHVSLPDPPIINLLGDKEMAAEAGAIFTDPSATIEDALGEDLSSLLVSNGSMIDVFSLGTQVITYSMEGSDRWGLQAVPVSRLVVVQDTEAPVSIFSCGFDLT